MLTSDNQFMLLFCLNDSCFVPAGSSSRTSCSQPLQVNAPFWQHSNNLPGVEEYNAVDLCVVQSSKERLEPAKSCYC